MSTQVKFVFTHTVHHGTFSARYWSCADSWTVRHPDGSIETLSTPAFLRRKAAAENRGWQVQ